MKKKLPVINLKLTGENIRRLRKESKISVIDLQHILGLSSCQSIYKWQRGECMPSIDNLVILAAIFKTTVDDIVISEKKDISQPAWMRKKE